MTLQVVLKMMMSPLKHTKQPKKFQEGNFNLRKWNTNSDTLLQRTNQVEGISEEITTQKKKRRERGNSESARKILGHPFGRDFL